MLRSVLEKLHFQDWSVPFALIIIGWLSFAGHLGDLGFYWDDWPAVWYYHLSGPDGFRDVFSVDRPLLGWLFNITSMVMGTSAMRWQLLGILARWMSATLFWLTARYVWPNHKNAAAWAAILFLVYPGFQQQHIAVTYSHVWILMAMFFGSLWMMILAIRKQAAFWPLSILSWTLSACVMFSVEYFFGLEMLRPILLNFSLRNKIPDIKERMKMVFRYWAPYLIVVIIFLTWRVLLSDTPRGDLTFFTFLRDSPMQAVSELVSRIAVDGLESSLFAWLQVFSINDLLNADFNKLAPFLGVVFSSGLFTLVFLTYLRGNRSEDVEPGKENTWALEYTITGLVALFFAGWPFWLTELPIQLRFPYDRFTLAMMTGASLLITGIIGTLGRPGWRRVILLSILVGLAVGFQDGIGDLYSRRWEQQKRFFWQLLWRAPAIEPGTVLLTTSWPFIYYSDNSLTAPLNWTYAPKNRSEHMDYLFYDIGVRLGGGVPALEPDIPLYEPYRITSFSGNTSKAVLFYYDAPACLRILDPQLDAHIYDYPELLYQALPLSKPELIETTSINQTALPPDIFGPEPRHDWCYTYEKAELARQSGDWNAIVKLAEKELPGNGRPQEPLEYLPFIEAYGRTGDWDNAIELTRQVVIWESRTKPTLCYLWDQIAEQSQLASDQIKYLETLDMELGCSSPTTPFEQP